MTKILLIENYAPDAQQSMLRFGELLAGRMRSRGWEVETVAPRVAFGRWASLAGPARRKWLGYLDKYVVFPRQLGALTRGRPLVHLVDHSNALYLPAHRGAAKWTATCHDLLAVRGALGEDTDCPASALGRRLQRDIVAGLARADGVACDSTSTLADLQRLVAAAASQERRVILLGTHHPYRPIGPAAAHARLAGCGGVPWQQPFLLHVGSNLLRKNKAGVVRVLARLRERWPGNVVFCGAPLTDELRAQAVAAGLSERVFAMPAPDNDQLEAAYSLAHALLFPSKCEGFGWPLIEAQACGCPVICSDRTSLPEVAGPGALVFRLDDEGGMAEAVVRLVEPAERARRVAAGVANLARFGGEAMTDRYEQFFCEVLAGKASGKPAEGPCLA